MTISKHHNNGVNTYLVKFPILQAVKDFPNADIGLGLQRLAARARAGGFLREGGGEGPRLMGLRLCSRQKPNEIYTDQPTYPACPIGRDIA
jgi:hypothetical protein